MVVEQADWDYLVKLGGEQDLASIGTDGVLAVVALNVTPPRVFFYEADGQVGGDVRSRRIRSGFSEEVIVGQAPKTSTGRLGLPFLQSDRKSNAPRRS